MTLRALSLGAADYVAKPSAVAALGEDSFRRELVQKIKGLVAPRRAAPPAALANRPRPSRQLRILAVGSSTGGRRLCSPWLAGLGRG